LRDVCPAGEDFAAGGFVETCLAGADLAADAPATAGLFAAFRAASAGAGFLAAAVFLVAAALAAAGLVAAAAFVGAGAPDLAAGFGAGAAAFALLRLEAGDVWGAEAFRDGDSAGLPLRAVTDAWTGAAAAFGGADGFREAFGAFGLPESRFAMSVPPKIAAFVRYENDPLFDLSILGRRSGGRQEKDERLPSGERHGRFI